MNNIDFEKKPQQIALSPLKGERLNPAQSHNKKDNKFPKKLLSGYGVNVNFYGNSKNTFNIVTKSNNDEKFDPSLDYHLFGQQAVNGQVKPIDRNTPKSSTQMARDAYNNQQK